LQAQCKSETVNDESEQLWKKIKFEQDTPSTTTVPHKENQEGKIYHFSLSFIHNMNVSNGTLNL
jgi:hypothetical protein